VRYSLNLPWHILIEKGDLFISHPAASVPSLTSIHSESPTGAELRAENPKPMTLEEASCYLIAKSSFLSPSETRKEGRRSWFLDSAWRSLLPRSILLEGVGNGWIQFGGW
jgi:hypothetical protein